jgi:predicted DNA-binding transcriptional regulator YafY
MTRAKISRMLSIVRLIQQPGCRTAYDIADSMDISYRTVIRDIDTLVNEWGLPIQYDRKNDTWTVDSIECRKAIIDIFSLEDYYA